MVRQLLATSSVYNVTGYYEVQNGSFETPSVTDYHQNTNNWQFSNKNYKNLKGVWRDNRYTCSRY